MSKSIWSMPTFAIYLIIHQQIVLFVCTVIIIIHSLFILIFVHVVLDHYYTIIPFLPISPFIAIVCSIFLFLLFFAFALLTVALNAVLDVYIWSQVILKTNRVT